MIVIFAITSRYIGLSSSELTCKSASFSGSNFRSSDRYRGSGNSPKSYASSDSYKGKERYYEDKFMKTTRSKRESSRHRSVLEYTLICRMSVTVKFLFFFYRILLTMFHFFLFPFPLSCLQKIQTLLFAQFSM